MTGKKTEDMTFSFLKTSEEPKGQVISLRTEVFGEKFRKWIFPPKMVESKNYK
jgi:hypothetical protein